MRTTQHRDVPRSAFRVRRSRSGQVIVFLLMALVAMAFIVLWNVDVHRILHVKSIARNAGDAAALAAARWQATALNLMGDLNLMKAIALGTGDGQAVDSIGAVQARLCFTGPMAAFEASQQAAKNNGIFSNPGFNALLDEHIRAVRNDYPAAVAADGSPLFPEPYPGAWVEYANMLQAVRDNGVAAGPDNARLYTDAVGGHILYLPDFYDAIAGQNWCWFLRNAPTLLEDYRNFFPCWWPPLPAPPDSRNINSEIYGLALATVDARLDSLADPAGLAALAAARQLPGTLHAVTNTATWYIYDQSRWSAWTAMATDGPEPFPLTGPLKPAYDYAGADAAVRIETAAGRLTPGPHGSSVSNRLTWTAAAKPFGYLDETQRPTRYGLVLPAYREVRLIPVDASSAPAGGGYNVEWQRHVRDHLPGYMEHGPDATAACYYCAQLVTWEIPTFRAAGVDWLDRNSWRCDAQDAGPGGGRGGGTRRGH